MPRAVGAEVINETCTVDHLFGFYTSVLDHNLLNPLANLTQFNSRACSIGPRPQDDTS